MMQAVTIKTAVLIIAGLILGNLALGILVQVGSAALSTSLQLPPGTKSAIRSGAENDLEPQFAGSRLQQVKADLANDNLIRPVMQVALTLIVLFFSIVVLKSPKEKYSDATHNVIHGLIGSVIGYWLG